MEKMNPEIKAKWLTALRGGDYQQGKGNLRRQVYGSDQYCCLGVLCDLYLKEVGEEWRACLGGVYSILGGEGEEATILPDKVMEWSGVYSGHGVIHGAGVTLAEVNDRSEDFTRVIELIEEYL